jgi:NAD(P)-dependent dehydrogenase (short-subunit alcohol dehydrogenase family)
LKAPSDSGDAMDALARARTLGAIVDRMAALAGPSGVEAQGHDSSTLRMEEFQIPDSGSTKDLAPSANGDPRVRNLGSGNLESPPSSESTILSIPRHTDGLSPVERRVLESVDAPISQDRAGVMPGGRVVVTDDGRGVAAELASRLEAEGIATELLGDPDNRVEWTSPSAVEAALEAIRARGPIAGVVHALPLGQPESDESVGAAWSDRIDESVKGLFLLARATAPDLHAAAEAGGSCLIAATALGGRFAVGGWPGESRFFSGQGGVAGLVKTLAREWPRVRCRVVDLAPGDPVAGQAGRLAVEVFAIDGWAEVGYAAGRRIRLRSLVSPLMRGNPAIELAPGDPILIT